MLKVTVVFLLMVAAAALEDDLFFRRFNFIQMMNRCYGERINHDWLESVVNAGKECHGEPLKTIWPGPPQEDMLSDLASLLGGDRPVILPETIPKGEAMGMPSSLPFQIPLDLVSTRQKHAALWDGPLLKGLMTKTMSKVSNFTCVLQKVKIIDEDLNLMVDEMSKVLEEVKLSPFLYQESVKGIKYCSKLAMCLPEDQSPLPLKIKQAVAFMKCDKKARMSLCMKNDILNYLGVFDTSELTLKNEDEVVLADKLLQILYGAEATDDFEVY